MLFYVDFSTAFVIRRAFKADEDNGRIFLPKIGYVRYRNSRKIEGIPKNVTVREEADGQTKHTSQICPQC